MLQVKAELIILYLCVGWGGGGRRDFRRRGHSHPQRLCQQNRQGRQLWEKDRGKNEINRVQLHTVHTVLLMMWLDGQWSKFHPNVSPYFPFPLINYCVCPCFQKRTVKKSQQAQPKAKKDSDIVRERIIRRAALEFQDGMYGILLKTNKQIDIIFFSPDYQNRSRQTGEMCIVLFSFPHE